MALPPRQIAPGDIGPVLAQARAGCDGDSIAALQSSNTVTARFTSSSGILPNACAQSGGRLSFDPSMNFGVGGERTDQVLARFEVSLAAFKANNVRFVLLICGTNDVFQKRPSQETIDNIIALAGILLGASITPIVSTILPRTYDGLATTSERTTARNQQSYINRKLRAWAAETPGVILLDIVRAITDPASAAGEPLGGAANPQGMTYDRLHPAPRLGYIGGKALLAALEPFFPKRQINYPTAIDLYHATENPKGNKLTNGKLAGTAGTAGTGASGNFATNFTASRTVGSTATIAGSKVVEPDPDGGASTEWQRCVVSATGGTGRDSVRLRQTVSAASAKYAVGEIVKLRTRVRIVAAAGLLGATPELVQQNGSTNTAVSTGMIFHAVSGVNYLWPNVAWEGVIETPPMTILGDVANVQCDLQIHVDAASANVTVDFADAEFVAA